MDRVHDRRTIGRIIVTAFVAVLCGCIAGAGWTATSSGTDDALPNTVRPGGHQRGVDLTGSMPHTPSDPLATVLSNAQASQASVVAQIGSDELTAELIGARLADGRTCFTVAHAGGKIIEPFNCASDALLRMWVDGHGDGEVSIANLESMRVLALVSEEVDHVRVGFADGTTRDLAPDVSGAIVLEVQGTSARPVSLEALTKDGKPLASVPLS